MVEILVKTNYEQYPIVISDSFDGLGDLLTRKNLLNKKICVITDENVEKIYIETIKKKLNQSFDEVLVYSFFPGERSKNLNTVSSIYGFLLNNKFDRKSVICALGGGVVGDMAGFVAATFLRGVPFIQIPTTLLSQVDSSVGGKVGVDFNGSKNMIGAFYQPRFVFINTSTLDSLSKREFSAGIAEVIKYAPIYSMDFYKYLVNNKNEIKSINKDNLTEIIKYSCQIKADIVSKDEKEDGLREILNFGHTIGHAVESMLDFKLLHGECVALGMVAAMHISLSRNDVSEDFILDFKELLRCYNLPVTIGYNVNLEDIYNQMFLDKKVKNNKLKLILFKENKGVYTATDVTKDEIIKSVSYIL